MGSPEEPTPHVKKPPGGEKPPEAESKKSFWTTLPGILTAITSLVVAIAGLIAALNNTGWIRPRPTPTPTFTSTSTATPTYTPTLTPTVTPTSTVTPTPTQTLIPTPTGTPTPIEKNLPTPSETFTLTPDGRLTVTPTLTPTETPTPTLVIASRLELCMRKMNDSAVVRQGPDITNPVLGNVPSEACLNFDVRLPDDSWVRIAEVQRDPYQGLAGGWVKAENLNELRDIDHLDIYKPSDAKDGRYCVSSYAGINVRDCADKACAVITSLRRGDCLIFNGRLEDNTWLRVASGQADYPELAEKWAAAVNLIVKEFLGFLDPHEMLPYFRLLPVVTPPPTPEG
jgi:hypothetical protein